jgi:integrase
MAAIKQRGKSYNVIYKTNGKQKWETFKTKREAENRKTEIEYQQNKGSFVPPNLTSIKDFLPEYVETYGTAHWGHSHYSKNIALINNYINPHIGHWKMKDITIRKMDTYFRDLKTKKSVGRKGQKEEPVLTTNRTIFEVNRLLSNAFKKAVEWEYIGKNPVTKNACPTYKSKKLEIWQPEEAQIALSVCTDLNLLAFMHLALACSMRIGEITGLQWKNLTFGDVENNFDDAKLNVEVQLQRIPKDTYEKLQRKKDDIKFIFQSVNRAKNTMLVLKSLKTESSKRVVWIPPTAATVLWKIKQKQDKMKELLGVEYYDYDLIIAHNNGRPVEGSDIDKRLKTLIKDNDLPEVTVHSLRYLSTTLKLTVCGASIKDVQGDTGHATAQMVTERYSHILDKNRKETAKTFENLFYKVGVKESSENHSAAQVDRLIESCLKDPEAMDILREIFNS